MKNEEFKSGLLFLNGNSVAHARKLMGKMFNFDNIKNNYSLIMKITN